MVDLSYRVHEADFYQGNYADQIGKISTALLAHKVRNLEDEEDASFVFAICGEWGSGKTRFVRRVTKAILERQSAQKEERESQSAPSKCEQEIRVLNFEPWIFADAKQLVQHFFLTLGKEFKSWGSADDVSHLADAVVSFGAIAGSIADLLIDPAMRLIVGNTARLISGVAEGVGGIGRACLDKKRKSFGFEQELFARKRSIANLIRKSSIGQTIVVMDDIDRLPITQIQALFQLVACVANFPKITYLLVFDRSVVTSALGADRADSESKRRDIGEAYLEKIVHQWYVLPQLNMIGLVSSMLIRSSNQLPDLPERCFPRIEEKHAINLLAGTLRTPRAMLRLADHYCNSASLGQRACSEKGCGNDALLCEAMLSLRLPRLYRAIVEGSTDDRRKVAKLGQILQKRFNLELAKRADQPVKAADASSKLNGVKRRNLTKSLADSNRTIVDKSTADYNQRRNSADQEKEEKACFEWLADAVGYNSSSLRTLNALVCVVCDIAQSGRSHVADEESGAFVEGAIICMLLSCASRTNALAAAGETIQPLQHTCRVDTAPSVLLDALGKIRR